ncbi:SGNH/GDSL hydrolase family protein [Helicobacter mustelae]|uniref:Putative periplasmic protein n=1 Tax=Helicobacter mustelae (strain ATCC 43772 / CCUG 25715 / CIP 103759 / LMG 18044 / NCTC 12198 / R85-136P) TaxID=679897 RepID=D3UGN5_HELM1|nr:DUF459 domain-containing protein [Helicobacter mustelae]CBG39656.1 putative periplasmic protein [Helicobacter mustelae 12198]SQH71166.1 Protein of uncharacterised function (DUF459) [Helicobacter mustelae]STP12294.1 Protein of uncharacterised function (DUF459) [Helicobacter mustelae]
MRFLHFFLSLCVIFLINIAAFHQSIKNYLEQKYHISIFPTKEPQEPKKTKISQPTPIKPTPKYPRIAGGKIEVLSHSNFLLIGDSMMQGIGMSLVSALKKMGFVVINEAKQSTGLTYVNFFNWPRELENLLKQNKIDVIVIMLGANDPWNLGKVRYGTPNWDAIYKERVDAILQLAKNYQSAVIWYEIPLVKNPKLSARLPHLNALYKEALQHSGDLFLSVNEIFAPNGNYAPFLENKDGKSISLRANDGIHFTRSGSRILTNLLLERITVIPREEKASQAASTAGMPQTTLKPTKEVAKPGVSTPTKDGQAPINPRPTKGKNP